MQDPTAPHRAGDIADDHRFVYAVARRIVRDDTDAADVAQDAMLQAHRYRASYRGDASYRTWLYQIATRAALSSLRRDRNSRRKVAAASADPSALPSDASPPPPADHGEILDGQAALARVAAQLGALDPKYRRVLELRFCEGRSERETAAALGLTTATVKVRTFRAKGMLRARLGLPAAPVARAAGA